MANRALGVNRIIVHTGAVKQAIWLLRWWADDGTDDPRILELMQQSRECARDLAADVRRHERTQR